MASINLLPWRDAYRKEKQQEFLAVIMAVAMVSVIAAYSWVASINSAIDNQRSRNQYLQTEIQLLEKKVAEISELKKRRTQLLERMKVIQGLQGKRPLIVRYFDELVRAVPEGVYITNLKRTGDMVSIDGLSESNVRVSALMRNLDESEWFASPNLSSVTAKPEMGEQASAFKLTFKTALPAAEGDDGASADGINAQSNSLKNGQSVKKTAKKPNGKEG